MTWREILGRLAAWRQRDALDRDFADNIDLHLDYLARDLEREGASPGATRAAAQRGTSTISKWRYKALAARH